MATRLERVLLVGQNEQQRRATTIMSAPTTANCDIGTMETEPTGTDTGIKKKVSEKVMAGILAAKAAEQAAIKSWLAPAPMPEPVFDADSLPVYVAVHAKGHRWAAGIVIDKILHTKQPTVRANGDIMLHIAINGDAYAVEKTDSVRKRNPNYKEFAFHFQPEFVVATNTTDPNRTMAHLMWLEFTSDELKTVCGRVDAMEASHKATHPGKAHIVLTVVANDGPYADLSVYTEPLEEPLRSTSSNELGIKPNTLALSRADFCNESDTAFVGPRTVV